MQVGITISLTFLWFRRIDRVIISSLGQVFPSYLGLLLYIYRYLCDLSTVRESRIALGITGKRDNSYFHTAKSLIRLGGLFHCEGNLFTQPQPVILASRLTPQGELRCYKGGHFDMYTGEVFEQAASFPNSVPA
jgi:hypothetical protein